MRAETRIPKEGVVRTIIESVLQNKSVRSQEELTAIIRRKLGHGSESYTISSRRARLIALGIPGMKVMVETRAGTVPDKCPSCFGELDRVYTKNLKGEKMLTRLSCAACPYEGRDNKWIPRRYSFTKP
jgi:hypothetical protein